MLITPVWAVWEHDRARHRQRCWHAVRSCAGHSALLVQQATIPLTARQMNLPAQMSPCSAALRRPRAHLPLFHCCRTCCQLVARQVLAADAFDTAAAAPGRCGCIVARGVAPPRLCRHRHQPALPPLPRAPSASACCTELLLDAAPASGSGSSALRPRAASCAARRPSIALLWVPQLLCANPNLQDRCHIAVRGPVAKPSAKEVQ
jgi:hypothetical protein